MAVIDTPQAQRANRAYFKQMMKTPLLEREHELDLARRWKRKGDEAALHELVAAYMRLAVSVASKYRFYGLPIGDLVQEGNIGLMQAAARFDPDRNVRFATYAGWWVRAAIQDYILRNWSIVRTGTTAAQKSLFFNLRRLRAQIEATPDAPLTPEAQATIAHKLKVSVGEVAGMEARLAAGDRSLNAEIAEDGERQWLDLLEDPAPNPEEVVTAMRDGATRAAWLNDALNQLNERERTIIWERRLTEDGVTLETLGHRLGISKERVRQIESQALDKLRSALTERAGDPVEAGLVG
ncbi:MAG TPA: RNA polymerase factor sigma-32 [Alphaproteobacteria bacterium]|nr:RNA polymerase factor sigma-32 [Alphaproteobacteria bacterium]